MSASRKRQSPHSRTRCTSIYATQDTTPACFCFPGYSTVIKNTARMVLVKAGNHGFYQYRSGWFYFFLSGGNTAEAGYPGIPRSRNMGITCPAMQRPVFEGGGRWVRLSANICQLHRPNTIPIFCAAVCRDYRLRTYIGIAFKFLLSSFRYFCVRVFPENACSAPANMICYRQSRNILLTRIGHGVFCYYSLRFSHFYGEAILNYLLEFFFAWTPNYQHKGIPGW